MIRRFDRLDEDLFSPQNLRQFHSKAIKYEKTPRDSKKDVEADNNKMIHLFVP